MSVGRGATGAQGPRDTSRSSRSGGRRRRVGLGSRTRHQLDRAGEQLRERFAERATRRASLRPRGSEVLGDVSPVDVEAASDRERSAA